MTSPRRLDRSYQTGLVWFRRDLRDTDNAALYYALKHCERVWCAFVFDTTILQPLIEIRRGEDGEARDRRIEFLHDTIGELDHALHEAGGGLIVLHGDPCDEIPALAKRLDVEAVFTNHDYEPQAIERDNEVRDRLREQKREFLTFKDQTIFERDEILTGQNKPYTVFTPYKNAWLKTVRAFDLKPYPVEKYHAQLARPPKGLHPASPTLEQLGFARSDLKELGMKTGMSGARHLLDTFETRIDSYAEQRDFPAMKATSHLSMHLRFGTISIRTLARMAHEMSLQPHGEGAATWLSELIWRDFYFMVLHYNPRLGEGASFKPEYDGIRWETGAKADTAFTAWCEGRTGYPLVDAAMLQLNRTGFMHNRLRMVTASFLTKDLGIDWHLGERYFALQLNDFDFSANNGGWQWAASTGCDAQPYFRIFNPVTQSEKFDAQGRFIKQFLPQLADVPPKYIHAPWQASADQLAQWGVRLGDNYPEPMVDHAAAREKTLARYGQ